LYKPSHFGEAFLSGIKVVQRMKTKTENKPENKPCKAKTGTHSD